MIRVGPHTQTRILGGTVPSSCEVATDYRHLLIVHHPVRRVPRPPERRSHFKQRVSRPTCVWLECIRIIKNNKKNALYFLQRGFILGGRRLKISRLLAGDKYRECLLMEKYYSLLNSLTFCRLFLQKR